MFPREDREEEVLVERRLRLDGRIVEMRFASGGSSNVGKQVGE